jgi:hypothetical protein
MRRRSNTNASGAPICRLGLGCFTLPFASSPASAVRRKDARIARSNRSASGRVNIAPDHACTEGKKPDQHETTESVS